MEPWFGNHGNGVGKSDLVAQAAASMEPWFGNHGNKGYSTRWMNAQLLQWSRGSVTTETSSCARLIPRPISSFNGAVVR